MKHTYLVMWHEKLGWGSPIPVLQPSKKVVTQATGLTNAKIRKQGWKWVEVTFETPDGPVSPEARLMIAKARIEELLDEVKELEGEVQARGDGSR